MHELEACQVMCKLLLATRYLVNSHILDVSFGYLRVPDLVMVTATEGWIKSEGQGRVNGIDGSIFDGPHAVVVAWMRGLYPDRNDHSWASRNRLGHPPEILIYKRLVSHAIANVENCAFTDHSSAQSGGRLNPDPHVSVAGVEPTLPCRRMRRST
jgi:hypothetical protein